MEGENEHSEIWKSGSFTFTQKIFQIRRDLNIYTRKKKKKFLMTV